MAAILLHVDHWDVNYQRVAHTPDGYALDPEAPVLRLGTVEQSARVVNGLTQRCWEATDTDGRRYIAANKVLVIEEMARGNGFTPITLNDTIPELWTEEEAS